MTLATSSSVVTAYGNGVTTAWPFAFEIPDADSMEVIVTTIATGAETTLAESVYSVSGLGVPAGGTVTYPISGTPLSSAYAITIRRNVAYTQETSIVNQGGFYPGVIEDALDRNVMMIQQLDDELNQRAYVPYGSGLDADDVIVDHEERIAAVEAAAISGGAFIAASQLEAETGTDNTKGMTPLRTVQSIQNMVPPINAEHYGMATGNTGAANRTALIAAVAAVPVGGTLLIPEMGGVVTIDTSGGLSAATLINKVMNVVVNGHLKMSYADEEEANPAFLFKVTSDSVTFSGTGTLEGSGLKGVEGGAGSSVLWPGLIHLTGDYFRYSGIRMLNPPKIGIYGSVATYGTFKNFIVEGGPHTFEPSTIIDPLDPDFGDVNPDYVGSYNVALTFTGGGYHNVDNVKSILASDNGRITILVFSAGDAGVANYCKVTNCHCDRPWEKLVYMYGNGHVIAGNTIIGSFGTYQTSAHGDVIRIWGSGNIAAYNISEDCRGGVQVLDGHHNKVFGNRFERCAGTAIAVQHFTDAYTGGISYNEVYNNYVSHNGVTTSAGAGIQFYSPYDDFYLCRCEGNTVLGYGQASDYGAIYFWTAGCIHYNSRICNNIIVSYTIGIKVQTGYDFVVDDNQFRVGTVSGVLALNCVGGVVSTNRGVSVGPWAFHVSGTTGVEFANNAMLGPTNNGINGVTGTLGSNWGHGNRYTTAPLIGEAVLASTATTTIDHNGVAANATIDFFPTSAAFATREAAVGFYTGVNGADFNIVTGNGSTNAGGEAFRYRINQ